MVLLHKVQKWCEKVICWAGDKEISGDKKQLGDAAPSNEKGAHDKAFVEEVVKEVRSSKRKAAVECGDTVHEPSLNAARLLPLRSSIKHHQLPFKTRLISHGSVLIIALYGPSFGCSDP